jgi:DnaJ-class molecular chaperone
MSGDMEDHYKTLELDEHASQNDIKKAYRKLSLLHHPDKNPGKMDISGKFQKISSAYEVLGNEDSRKQYDAERNNPFLRMGAGGGGFPGSQGIDEMLANLFFGGMAQGMPGMMHQGMGHPGMSHMQHPGMGHSPFGNFFPPGANIKIFRNGTQVNMQQALEKPTPIVKTVEIYMESVLSGATVPVEIERWLIDNGSKVFECETVYVPIPKGIDDNEMIVLRDKGNILSEECKGDIKIFIKVVNNSEFKRQGLDLILDKDITLKEALCGFSFELKYINGKSYTINNNMGNIIKPEYKKTIPNMGLERDNHRGNVIICFHVVFPDTLDVGALEKLKALL